MQQLFPQQVVFAAQSTFAWQVGDWHAPLLQKAVGAWQMLPHFPQLKGSFCRLTQLPPQHIRPVVHSTLQTAPPPAPLAPPAPAPPAEPAEPPLPPRPVVPAMPVVPPRPAVPVVPPRPTVPVVPPRPAVPVVSEPPLPVLPAMPVVPPAPVVPAIPVAPPAPVAPAAPPAPPPPDPAEASILDPPVTLPQAASVHAKRTTAISAAAFVRGDRSIMTSPIMRSPAPRRDDPHAQRVGAGCVLWRVGGADHLTDEQRADALAAGCHGRAVGFVTGPRPADGHRGAIPSLSAGCR
ncbi:MAG: hypothetical protein ABUS79_03465 [Pseudomonadota bacterium]